jgi:hypothetical protein
MFATSSGAAIIKPKAIDERVILGESKQSRLFVSALRLVGDGADFDKPKPSAASASAARPFLSNPAARPTGLANSSPNL